MSKFATLVVILLAGCSASPPDLRPLVAVSGTYSLLKPSPTPAPAPAGICKSCRGTGRVGDGVHSVPCAACGGTGKVVACKDGKCTTPNTGR
jgi:hypothetical protein